MKSLDEILLEAIPPVQNCEPKNNAAKEARARAKQQIVELFVPRDKTQPYKPDLEYKSK